MKAKKKKIVRKKAVKATGLSEAEKTKFLNELKVVSVADLKKMNLHKLNRYADELVKQLEEFHIQAYCFADLSGYKALQNVFKIRNARTLQAAIKSSLWKRLIKENCRLEAWHVDIVSRDKMIEIELPYQLAEKAIRQVFDDYKDSTMGFWSLVFLKDGVIKDLIIADTADRDLFFRNFLKLSERERRGGSPKFSAKIFKAGTVIKGKDRRWYEVKLYGSIKRWVPFKEKADKRVG